MNDPQTTAIPEPQRILVIETLYLGDLVHTLPLIQALRARYPAAQLDVLVRAAHLPLMAHVAGIDTVLAMDPAKHRSLGGLRHLVRELRARRYDLVVNPGASDRATLLTWLSGGQRRIGRLNRKQSRRLWPLLHDDVIDHPWAAEPMYWQKLLSFQHSLQLRHEVRFGLDFSAVDLGDLQLPAQYLHVSPFASEDIRCLPPSTIVELSSELRRLLPALPLVVSCGPSARERARLAAITPALVALDVRCLAGTLSLPELGALIQRASLHLGADSGPLHLAMALNTPTVGCFLFKDASAEWIPVGGQHRSFGVVTRLQSGLHGLPVESITRHLVQLLG